MLDNSKHKRPFLFSRTLIRFNDGSLTNRYMYRRFDSRLSLRIKESKVISYDYPTTAIRNQGKVNININVLLYGIPNIISSKSNISWVTSIIDVLGLIHYF